MPPIYWPAFAAVIWLAMVQAAFPLGYPTPEPKPCKTYWDSRFWHRKAATDPAVAAYMASPHEVIVALKNGSGVIATHDKRGCLVLTPIHSDHVKRLFSLQRDS